MMATVNLSVLPGTGVMVPAVPPVTVRRDGSRTTHPDSPKVIVTITGFLLVNPPETSVEERVVEGWAAS